VLFDQTMKLLFGLLDFPGMAICEEIGGILTVYSAMPILIAIGIKHG
jgi:hypothetical protein